MLVLLGFTLIGVVLFVVRSTPALAGCAAAIWLNASIVTWFAGSKLAGLIPSKIMPEHAVLRMGDGTSLALAGALLMVAGATTVLAEQTWNIRPAMVPRWSTWATSSLLLACLSVREFSWFDISAADFSWSLDFGMLPVIGDVLSIAMFVTLVLLVVQLVRPRRWVAISEICASAFIFLLSGLAAASTNLFQHGAEQLVRRIDFLSQLNPAVVSTRGPLALTAVSALVMLFGSVSLWTTRGSASDRSPASQTMETFDTGAPFASALGSRDDDLPF